MEINKIINQAPILIRVRFFDEKENSYDKIVFHFEMFSLVISVDCDTDEIILNMTSNTKVDNSLFVPKWNNNIVENKIISFWTGNNDQGYFDLFILGMKALQPNLQIYCMASQLFVKYI